MRAPRPSRLFVLALAAFGWAWWGGGAAGRTTVPDPSPFAQEVLAACDAASIVVVGERHRQAASHRFFLELVERLAARGERVSVGLEIPSDRQRELEGALRGRRSPAGVAHPIIDSTSYQELIRGLGALIGTLPVAVYAIDAPRGGSGDRDAAMAARIGALAAGGCDRVLVLVGNLHALKTIPWARRVRPRPEKLAELLADAGLSVASVIQSFPGDCAGGGRLPAFHPAGEAGATGAVRDLWAQLNTDPTRVASLAPLAADGVISWACGE